jgi:glycosyltransferase involved in cell wall biosynthesis
MYSHPEFYPPTLNAIEFLSSEFKNIYIVHRNVGLNSFTWKYPDNVKLLTCGKQLSAKEILGENVFSKFWNYLKFTFLLLQTLKLTKPKVLLVYDYYPWIAYRIIKFFINKLVLWYHNHDAAEAIYTKRWSLGWWAWQAEKNEFKNIDILTLPAMERLQYFPIERFKGTFFFLPNFPSVHVYNKYSNNKKIQGSEVKILFQGSIGKMHGIEEIITLLNTKIKERSLKLVLKGFISEDYKFTLLQLAKKFEVVSRIIFIGPTGYIEVIKNAQTCHIGIGIHMKNDIMNKTLGTASNKIYEYAASGMPVIVYDNEHFRQKLEQKTWAKFTDVSKPSLIKVLEEIIDNYETLSRQAIDDFRKELCFENYINPIVNYLRTKL